jgi:hypothetical protein
MISDKAKIALLKAAPKLSHIELIELVIEECQQSQRQWVGLTDEEMHDCWDSPLTPLGMKHARMIEAKLKEKNT